MKRTLLYLIGGIALICIVFLLFQDKKADVSKTEKTDFIKEDGDLDMKNNRKKFASFNKKVIGTKNIESSITKKEGKNGISIIYELQNNGDQDIRLQFPSSQEYDYEIYNEKGDLVYRYSDEHVFSQVISNVLFAKGQTLTFVAELPKLEKGEYKIIIWPAARGLEGLKEEITV